MGIEKLLLLLLHAQTRGHGEQAHMVVALPLGRHKVGQTTAGAHHAIDFLFLGLLAQAVPGERDGAAALVGVELNVVVVHRVGRVQADHPVGAQPAAFDDLLEHGLGVGKYLGCLLAHHLIGEDGGVRAGEVPGLEKRPPVDVLRDLGQVEILEHALAHELGLDRLECAPVDGRLVGPGPVDGPHGHLLFVGVLCAHLVVIGVELGDVLNPTVADQALRHAHAARRIGHVHHRAVVVPRDLHRGVHATGRRATDQQRDLGIAEMRVLLHLAGHILHLLQAGRDQAREAHDVGALFLGLGQDFVAGHHHAHVHHLKVVALEHNGHDVFADVVHVALDGGDHDLALGLHIAAGRFQLALLFFDVGQQMGHGLLHDARALDHLWQEHLALAEQVAHHVHAVHQRPFDHIERAPAVGADELPHLLGVFGDELVHAAHQGVREPLADRQRPPLVFLAVVPGLTLGVLGHLHQTLTGVGPAVEHHVFDPLAQCGFELVVNTHHARVDDAHVHAGLDGVVQEDGVDGLAHRVVAAETERHVGHAAAHLGARQVLLDPARGVDEIHRVVVVLLDAGGDGKDVGIEDDVFRRKAHFVDQHAVRPLADLDLAFESVGLALFIEGHHHGRRTIALDQPGLALELVQTLFHADGVDDALALDALQAGFDHLPFGAVHHDRHPRNVGLAGDQVEKTHHGGLAVEHGLVHVDVDHLRAVLHLLAGHGQGLLVLAVEDHAGESLGAGHVGAFPHVDEQAALGNAQRLQAGQQHGRNSNSGDRGNDRHGGSPGFLHGLVSAVEAGWPGGDTSCPVDPSLTTGNPAEGATHGAAALLGPAQILTAAPGTVPQRPSAVGDRYHTPAQQAPFLRFANNVNIHLTVVRPAVNSLCKLLLFGARNFGHDPFAIDPFARHRGPICRASERGHAHAGREAGSGERSLLACNRAQRLASGRGGARPGPDRPRSGPLAQQPDRQPPAPLAARSGRIPVAEGHTQRAAERHPWRPGRHARPRRHHPRPGLAQRPRRAPIRGPRTARPVGPSGADADHRPGQLHSPDAQSRAGL